MKHIWSVLCQKSVIDNETNSISLLDCLEQLNITIGKEMVKTDSKTMVVPIDFQIVSFWLLDGSAKGDKLETKINLYDPENNLIKSFPGEYILTKSYARFRSRAKIQGLPITKDGRYIFKVSIKSKGRKEYKRVAELPLDISIKYKIFDIKK